ncbi:DUF2911 domain-containing protein [Ferruginibacter yonginensis]|uniref:DUF2911 domain-containing protein n=1 Tax=Ferruginibacter yonginensis TaxID=1310416 RepID=A0ABV8QU91_9BACT
MSVCIRFCGWLFLMSLLSCNQQPSTPVATNKVNETNTVFQKDNPYVTEDQSGMDMSWCPTAYPIEKMKGNILPLIARVIYSRPHKKGRNIFGADTNYVCMYGKPWRLGANEATEIDFFENVVINGQNVAKGTYVLYCIPQADKWTIILNSDIYTWGLHINEANDIYKFEIPTTKQNPALNDFTMVFQDTPTGADLIIAWDNVKANLPITFSKK